MEQSVFSCKSCGQPVHVVNAETVRSCSCPNDTAVIANISAVATGTGGASS